MLYYIQENERGLNIMDYICPHCDTELELVEVETYQDFGGSSTMTQFNTWHCPTCGRTYQNEVNYIYSDETDIKEID